MRRSDDPYRRRDDESLRGDYPRGDYSDRGRRRGDDYPRGDDDYLRRSPNRQYGSNDQGYSDLPAHERNERLRHLSSRHGNPERRLPREVPRGTWGEGGREDEEWVGVYVEEWRWPPGPESASEAYGRQRGEPRQYSMYGLGDPRGQRRPEYGFERRGDPGYRRSQGPRNYRRSDDRVHDEVCTRLAHEDGLDVSEVTVHVRDGVVTMEGTVNDRRSKYEIEDIAASVFGVNDVINHIRVHRYGMLASE